MNEKLTFQIIRRIGHITDLDELELIKAELQARIETVRRLIDPVKLRPGMPVEFRGVPTGGIVKGEVRRLEGQIAVIISNSSEQVWRVPVNLVRKRAGA